MHKAMGGVRLSRLSEARSNRSLVEMGLTLSRCVCVCGVCVGCVCVVCVSVVCVSVCVCVCGVCGVCGVCVCVVCACVVCVSVCGVCVWCV